MVMEEEAIVVEVAFGGDDGSGRGGDHGRGGGCKMRVFGLEEEKISYGKRMSIQRNKD